MGQTSHSLHCSLPLVLLAAKDEEASEESVQCVGECWCFLQQQSSISSSSVNQLPNLKADGALAEGNLVVEQVFCCWDRQQGEEDEEEEGGGQEEGAGHQAT